MGEALVKGGGVVSEVKTGSAVETDEVGTGEGCLCKAVCGGGEDGTLFGSKVELDRGNCLTV